MCRRSVNAWHSEIRMNDQIPGLLITVYCLVVGLLAIRGVIPLWAALAGLILSAGTFVVIGWKPTFS